MAEYIRRKTDNTNDNPVKDARRCYKHNDIISVHPDGSYKVKPSPGVNFTWVIVTDLGFENAGAYVCKKVEIIADMEQTIFMSRYVISDNVKPENAMRYQQCLDNGDPYITDSDEFLNYMLEEK